MNATFPQELDKTHARIKANLRTHKRGPDWRRGQILALKKLLTENEEAINEAMWKDLHKSPFECVATEQGFVLAEIEYTLKKLDGWMKPDSVPTPIFNQIGSSHIIHEPYGLTLVIGAWNYPINLLLAPVVGAISGGNAVVIKPSEIAVNTGHLIAKLIPMYMDNDLIAVVEGGPEETSLLLDKPFDLIFFTGSTNVGKIVLAKAAQHVTPVVLELGGKSPALVLPDADIKVIAKRLVWGKFMNGGQTCVAPDYILVDATVKEALVKELKETITAFYGEDPQTSPDYCRIINSKNFQRLIGLLEGSQVLFGGKHHEPSLYIEPTLLESTGNSKVMSEEIFGPLLPIISMPNLESMIQFVNERPKPLALYAFGQENTFLDRILNETSSGGVTINDVIMHMSSTTLPFGGVGNSGMGHYHGKFSFETFTHAKSVLKKSTLLDVPVRYAPYSMKKLKWLKKLFQ